MKTFALILVASVALFLSGCLPEDAVGRYDAEDGDAIRIEKDGKTFWLDGSDTSAGFQFLGILSVNKEKNESTLTMPSAHPYLFIRIKFTEDLSSLTVEWQRFDRSEVTNRSSEYSKSKQ